MIPPTQASKRATPLLSEDCPVIASPSAAPNPPVSKETPKILATRAMTTPFTLEIRAGAAQHGGSSPPGSRLQSVEYHRQGDLLE